ncbi:PoNi-like cognate immunity protein [uncultured Apibacter sp.]|uniref:PoNi-like cognate immunity protein n=1 Tax=uncultured Apibacter sp. TaxID=1778616 RepID=UPI0025CE655A|nr:PoNi-like cognate immunity protein [uncultured Apibacter sp.]
MKIRDRLSTQENYQEIIDFDMETILKIKKEIEKLKESEKKGIQLYRRPNIEAIQYSYDDIFSYKYNLFLAEYSKGENMEKIEPIYYSLIESMEQSWKKSNGYIEMIWTLSIGIMLEVEKEIFDKLKSLVERDNLNDYLVDFLLQHSATQWSKQTTRFEFPVPYKNLSEVIGVSFTDKYKALELLKNYLQKKWYKGHSDMGWYNAHKSKFNIHTGYWSFESGAVAKILQLDDSSLKEQQYYPYDMVHWKD